MAEAHYGAGTAGVLGAYGLLGLALGLGAALVRRRAPRVLVAIGAMTIAWTGLVFLRGDAGNAAFVASSWIIPAAVLAALLVRRAARRPQRLVVDALQVPVEFSGVGRGAARDRGRADAAPAGHARRPALPARRGPRPGARLSPRLRGADPARAQPAALAPHRRPAGAAELRDGPRTVLLCPGDQAPVITRARVVLAVYDFAA